MKTETTKTSTVPTWPQGSRQPKVGEQVFYEHQCWQVIGTGHGFLRIRRSVGWFKYETKNVRAKDVF